jgi:biopolymer transport protein ExbB
MLQAHLLTAGPIIYPLIFCSVLVGALVLERLITHCLYPVVHAELLQRQFLQGAISDVEIDSRKARGLKAGLALLAQHASTEKSLREERMGLWLQEQRQYLLLRTRWLNLLGTVAPLLGLLGTVLGIITMFQDVAHQSGPVTPALLAGGMWEAMATTAAGLIIAIPALCAGQLLTFWADRRIEVMQNVLNHCSLSLESELPLESKSPRKHSAASAPSASAAKREVIEREQYA